MTMDDEPPEADPQAGDDPDRGEPRPPNAAIPATTPRGVIEGGEWIGPDDAGLFTAEEYRRALRQKWTEADAEEIVADELRLNAFEKRGTVWDDYALGLVAMLSPEHRTRIQRHRGWTDEEMEAKLAWVRARSPYPPPHPGETRQH